MLVLVQGDDPCKTLNGETCNKNHPYNSYYGADPCFESNGQTVCFFSTTNYVRNGMALLIMIPKGPFINDVTLFRGS